MIGNGRQLTAIIFAILSSRMPIQYFSIFIFVYKVTLFFDNEKKDINILVGKHRPSVFDTIWLLYFLKSSYLLDSHSGGIIRSQKWVLDFRHNYHM